MRKTNRDLTRVQHRLIQFCNLPLFTLILDQGSVVKKNPGSRDIIRLFLGECKDMTSSPREIVGTIMSKVVVCLT